MGKMQSSKRARKAREKAKFMGLPGHVGHPSHVSGRRWIEGKPMELTKEERRIYEGND